MEDTPGLDKEPSPKKFSRRQMIFGLRERLKNTENLLIPDSLSEEKKEEVRKYNRRDFLGLGLAAAGGAFIGWGLNKLTTPGKVKEVSSEPGPEPFMLRPKAIPDDLQTVENLSDHALLSRVLKSELNSDRRNEAEQALFDRAQTLDQIDKAFWGIANSSLRMKLLDKRYALRDKESFKEQIKWAEENGIHPEVLAICMEAYADAKPVIQSELDKSKEGFRPDLAHKVKIGDLPAHYLDCIDAEKIMLSAGGAAKLICTETGIGDYITSSDGREILVSYGFANIGTGPAISRIKKGEKDEEYLRELVMELRSKTAYEFTAETIPGSLAGSKDATGGAIGPQERAGVALDLFRTYGINPFDLRSCTKGIFIFFARGQKVSSTDLRYGYLKESNYDKDEKIIGVIGRIKKASGEKWNEDDKQLNQVLGANLSYISRFPDNLPKAA